MTYGQSEGRAHSVAYQDMSYSLTLEYKIHNSRFAAEGGQFAAEGL